MIDGGDHVGEHIRRPMPKHASRNRAATIRAAANAVQRRAPASRRAPVSSSARAIRR